METERNKPDCPLIGQDGNVFNLIGIASRTLKENGMAAEASEMSSRVFASGSYSEALSIIDRIISTLRSGVSSCCNTCYQLSVKCCV